jgi:hypothetical protein
MFLAKVAAIYGEHPTYREGGIARDGTCDCVGMVIAAMTRAGHSAYELKSSNYFARYQIVDMLLDISESDVYIGMVVFKRRYEGDVRYKLPDRDNVGGRYYNGDLTDYYHIGVVTGVDPLVITHCTSGGGVDGTTKDYKLGSWSCGGRLKGVNYEDYTSTGDSESSVGEGVDSMVYENGVQAVVNKGKAGTSTWNLRSSPDDSSRDNVIGTIPFGVEITVYETAGGWAQIEYDGQRSYLKTTGFTIKSDSSTDTDPTGRTLAEAFAEIDAIKKRLDDGGL